MHFCAFIEAVAAIHVYSKSVNMHVTFNYCNHKHTYIIFIHCEFYFCMNAHILLKTLAWKYGVVLQKILECSVLLVRFQDTNC